MTRDSYMANRIVSAIASLSAAEGRPPTIQEIADRVYCSTTTVAYWLDRLEYDGRITREFGKHRSIRVVEAVR